MNLGFVTRHVSQIVTSRTISSSSSSLAKLFCVLVLCAATVVVLGRHSYAATTNLTVSEFRTWVANFRREALSNGITAQTFDNAFATVKAPKKSIVKSVSSQPEVVRTSGDYISSLVSQGRINLGREKLDGHQALLTAIETKYGVDAQIIVALWGVETFYGRLSGKHNIIQSLATLAATHKRREKYWRAELLAALEIIQNRHVTASTVKGSWAGAMGHIQFMPTTYQNYAVDFDRDGRRDIWTSKADALASAAKFLKAKGWQRDEAWGFEVRLPQDFDLAAITPSEKQPLSTWQSRRVTPASGIGWPDVRGPLQLILPSGINGPAFLVTRNFKVLMRYNPSTRYALAVAHLSDRIAGAPKISQAWPDATTVLRRPERKELQRLLSEKGHAIGPVDGVIGRNTRKAIRRFQAQQGVPADGHPSKELLQRLRTAAR